MYYSWEVIRSYNLSLGIIIILHLRWVVIYSNLNELNFINGNKFFFPNCTPLIHVGRWFPDKFDLKMQVSKSKVKFYMLIQNNILFNWNEFVYSSNSNSSWDADINMRNSSLLRSSHSLLSASSCKLLVRHILRINLHGVKPIYICWTPVDYDGFLASKWFVYSNNSTLIWLELAIFPSQRSR